MKRWTLFLLTTVAAFSQEGGGGPAAKTLPKTETEKTILAAIENVAKTHQTYLSVPPEDGRALRLLAEAVGAKEIAEIGTSTGYSGLWFCLALANTGGHLTTFEQSRSRAAMAREHFKQAGVERMVTIVEGDAHSEISKFNKSLDLVFIDADKEGYVDYFNKVLPRVRPGGLILAHNVDMVPDYVRLVGANPAIETIYYMQGGGLAVTLKKR